MISYLSPVTLNVVKRRLDNLWEINVKHVRSDAHYGPIFFVKLLIYQMDVATISMPRSPQICVFLSSAIRDVDIMRRGGSLY